MAHIVNLMTPVETSSAKPSSPSPTLTSEPRIISPLNIPGKKVEDWRMKQLPEQPKAEQGRGYRLFPRERQLPILNNTKALDGSKTSPTVSGLREDKMDPPSAAAILKNKLNQHSLVRRRKISVPELGGAMTTVHELPMDSPTIPGRPPLHERSASVPTDESHSDTLKAFAFDAQRLGTPKPLAPLVIPPNLTQSSAQTQPKRPTGLSQTTNATEESIKTSQSSDSPRRTPHSAQNSTVDFTVNPPPTAPLPTPVSAPATESYRPSPRPWESQSYTPTSSMERSMTSSGSQRSEKPIPRRRASESSSDRGRARKRGDSRPNDGSQRVCSQIPEKSAERRVFDELPTGSYPKDVVNKLSADEIAKLKKQSLEQAERSEVLRFEEVEQLSKELRYLDERSEYLRRTYTSLRAGRRNLHTRMCQFLNSARVAKFSYESMIKQHEALAELDASIEDWVNKLEVVENRRTRVRQKLLEHVAAAAILPTSKATLISDEPLQTVVEIPSHSSLHHITTPPRSPAKSTGSGYRSPSTSPSPQRVVAQVPSTIFENPIDEEAETLSEESARRGPAAWKRSDVESIRIYAGDEIYALLTDVENEISNMNMPSNMNTNSSPEHSPLPAPERKKLNRKRSHEIFGLNGRIDTSSTESLNKLETQSVTSDSSQTLSPLTKSAASPVPAPDELFLLSNAVFKP